MVPTLPNQKRQLIISIKRLLLQNLYGLPHIFNENFEQIHTHFPGSSTFTPIHFKQCQFIIGRCFSVFQVINTQITLLSERSTDYAHRLKDQCVGFFLVYHDN